MELTSLPDEAFASMTRNCNMQSLLCLRQTCKRMQQICAEQLQRRLSCGIGLAEATASSHRLRAVDATARAQSGKGLSLEAILNALPHDAAASLSLGGLTLRTGRTTALARSLESARPALQVVRAESAASERYSAWAPEQAAFEDQLEAWGLPKDKSGLILKTFTYKGRLGVLSSTMQLKKFPLLLGADSLRSLAERRPHQAICRPMPSGVCELRLAADPYRRGRPNSVGPGVVLPTNGVITVPAHVRARAFEEIQGGALWEAMLEAQATFGDVHLEACISGLYAARGDILTIGEGGVACSMRIHSTYTGKSAVGVLRRGMPAHPNNGSRAARRLNALLHDAPHLLPELQKEAGMLSSNFDASIYCALSGFVSPSCPYADLAAMGPSDLQANEVFVWSFQLMLLETADRLDRAEMMLLARTITQVHSNSLLALQFMDRTSQPASLATWEQLVVQSYDAVCARAAADGYDSTRYLQASFCSLLDDLKAGSTCSTLAAAIERYAQTCLGIEWRRTDMNEVPDDEPHKDLYEFLRARFKFVTELASILDDADRPEPVSFGLFASRSRASWSDRDGQAQYSRSSAGLGHHDCNTATGAMASLIMLYVCGGDQSVIDELESVDRPARERSAARLSPRSALSAFYHKTEGI